MTLDELKDGDDKLELEGFTVIAEKSLLEQMSGISIDFRDSTYGAGFIVNPGKTEEKSCGSCSC